MLSSKAPQTTNALFAHAIQLFKKSFWYSLPLNLGLMILPAVLMIVTLLILVFIAKQLGFPPDFVNSSNKILWLTLTLGMVLPLGVFSYLILACGLTRSISGYSHERKYSRRQSLYFGLKKSPALFLSLLVYLLLSCVGLACLIVTLSLLRSFWPPIASLLAFDILSVLRMLGLLSCLLATGWIICYVPVVTLFYFGNIVIYENGVFASFFNSVKMVRGKFWRVTAFLSIPFLLLLMISILANAISPLLDLPIHFVLRSIMPTVALVTLNMHFSAYLLHFLISVFGPPFCLAFYLTQLYELKRHLEP